MVKILGGGGKLFFSAKFSNYYSDKAIQNYFENPLTEKYLIFTFY